MSTAVLSVGSNVGDRRAALQSAVDAFRAGLIAVSPVYETPPWGPVPQDDYLNAVLVVQDDDAKPDDWLRRAHDVEQAANRTRDVRWGPRTLDVDIVTVDDVVNDDPILTLPHPRVAERAFVLIPWRDVQPGATLRGVPISELIEALPATDVMGVRLRADKEIS